jgi:hypothetical protein
VPPAKKTPGIGMEASHAPPLEAKDPERRTLNLVQSVAARQGNKRAGKGSRPAVVKEVKIQDIQVRRSRLCAARSKEKSSAWQCEQVDFPGDEEGGEDEGELKRGGTEDAIGASGGGGGDGTIEVDESLGDGTGDDGDAEDLDGLDEWDDDDDPGYVAFPVSDQEFYDLEEEAMEAAHRAALVVKLGKQRSGAHL